VPESGDTEVLLDGRAGDPPGVAEEHGREQIAARTTYPVDLP
jgi:hypothetical protein